MSARRLAREVPSAAKPGETAPAGRGSTFATSQSPTGAPLQASAGIRSWPSPFVSATVIAEEAKEFFSMYG